MCEVVDWNYILYTESIVSITKINYNYDNDITWYLPFENQHCYGITTITDLKSKRNTGIAI